MEDIKNKRDALTNIDIVIRSCEEGKSGEWDCNTVEGKEGFDDMIYVLEAVKEYMQKNLPENSVDFITKKD